VVIFQAGCDVIVISLPGGVARNFLIADSERAIIVNTRLMMHRFRFYELFMFARNDVIAISSLWGASGNFSLRILKG